MKARTCFDTLVIANLFLFLACSISHAVVPQIERDALVVLYNATDGANWDNGTNWLIGDPCDNSWYGVGCNTLKTNVTSLDLSYNDLNGSIPSEIGNLSELKNLYFYGNYLSGSIPSEMGNLLKLRYLALANNQLSGNIPTQMGNLAVLYHLYMEFNQLSGSIPSEMGLLSQLKVFWSHYNQLWGTIPSELGNLSHLVYLSLANNDLSGNIPSELGYIPYLFELNLGYNHLGGSIPSELGNLSNLQYFCLNSNKFTGEIPSEFLNLTMLYYNSSDLRWNALYTENDALRTFLNSKQMDGDWESTQTIAPSDLTATTTTFSEISVNWSPIPYTEDNGGYELYYHTQSGGPYTYFDRTVDKAASSMEVFGLDPGTTYYFIVQTVTESHSHNTNTVHSEQSEEVLATTTDVPTLSMLGFLVLLIGISFIFTRIKICESP